MNSLFHGKRKGDESIRYDENYQQIADQNKENIKPSKDNSYKKLSRTPLQDITNTFKFDNDKLIYSIKEEQNISNYIQSDKSQGYLSTAKKANKRTELKMIR